jgi:GrpB-like predicted nucleotidyltransferase (UPF0157 family)
MTVKLVPYDPTWPIAFGELKKVLYGYLESLPLTIEHVGSTSVPGLLAKPTLDIDIVLPDESFLNEVSTRLQTVGYTPEGEMGVPGRYAFKRMGPDVPHSATRREWPRHNLYAGAGDASGIKEHLIFRDVLRKNPVIAAQYAALKLELAEKHNDVNAYSEAKTDFVRNVLRLSIQSRDPIGDH